ATLGLRLFLNLAFQGPDGMAAYLDGRFALARTAHDLIQARPGFSCPYEPESNILCFRHAGDDAAATFVEEWARGAGLEADRLEATPGRPSVLVRAPGRGGGGTLLLCG